MTSTPSAFKAWLIWSLSALFYFYEFALQSSPSVMVPELMRDFQVTGTQLGHLSAFYFYAYAAMQIPVGLLLDRFGPRLLLTLACLICALGALAFSQTHSLGLAEIARFLMGIGSSFAVVSSLKLANLWFPAKRFALLTGLMVTFGMLGAIGGQTVLAPLVDSLGWRHSMMLLSLIGLLLAGLICGLVRNGEKFTALQLSHQTNSYWLGLKNILLTRQAWLMALYGGLMFAPTVAFGELWGVPYLISLFGVTRHVAAQVLSLIFVGWAIGSPVFGILTGYFNKNLLFMWLAPLGCLVTMAWILFVDHHSITPVALLLFFFGFFSSAFLAVFSLLKETTPERSVGTAMGFLNTLNELGPALLLPLFGWLLDRGWAGKIIDNTRSYSSQNYHDAALALMLVLGAAALLMCFIRLQPTIKHENP